MVKVMGLRLTDGTIDLRAGCVIRGCGEFRLTARERDLLRYLQARSHRVVSREELMREVWEYSDGARSRAVDFTVHRLRTKIEIDPTVPRHLLTVHGVGYQLVPADLETAEVPTGQVALLAARLASEPEGIDGSDLALAISERLVGLAALRAGHAARADGQRWLAAFSSPVDALGVARGLFDVPGCAFALSVAVCWGVPRCVREPVSGRWDYRGPAVQHALALSETVPPGRVAIDDAMARALRAEGVQATGVGGGKIREDRLDLLVAEWAVRGDRAVVRIGRG